MRITPIGGFNIKRRILFGFLVGVGVSLIVAYFIHGGIEYTSTDQFCESCHVHPHATRSWKDGPHYKTASGLVAHCVDCHLPPKGIEHFTEKTKAGARDVYGYLFKDISKIDWEAKSVLDHALTYTFDSACTNCHVELFPVGLPEKAVDPHLHYTKNREELRCINCHLTVGHFHEEKPAPEEVTREVLTDEDDEERTPLVSEIAPDALVNYIEVTPKTDVTFEMVAIPGGTFLIGSSEAEPFRDGDEGPQRQVKVSSFWMGKFEVSWREHEAYYAQTATYGKNEKGEETDAITGPTPPYQPPDQGWGKGSRPAITMTYYAAEKYCEWLSAVTGRKYRLPTEAEWEYACRAGTIGPYFFDGLPESWLDRWFGKLVGGMINEDFLQEHAWYRANSSMKTHPSETKKPNPWGLHNMIGNVKEFCQDWYDPNIYEKYAADALVIDPAGPPNGEEHVIRGGSFKSRPGELRSAARNHTRHDEWLKTDPQAPKSVWWYSDNNDVGFRLVREYKGGEEAGN